MLMLIDVLNLTRVLTSGSGLESLTLHSLQHLYSGTCPVGEAHSVGNWKPRRHCYTSKLSAA